MHSISEVLINLSRLSYIIIGQYNESEVYKKQEYGCVDMKQGTYKYLKKKDNIITRKYNYYLPATAAYNAPRGENIARYLA